MSLLEKELKDIEYKLNYDTIRNAAQDEMDVRLQEIYQKLEERLPENQEELLVSFVAIMKGYPFVGKDAISCVYNCAVEMMNLVKEIKLYRNSVYNCCNNIAPITMNLVDIQKRYISAKEEYYDVTNRKIPDTLVGFLKELAYCQMVEKKALLKRKGEVLEALKQFALDNVKSSFVLTDELVCVENLPETIDIGNYNSCNFHTMDNVINDNVLSVQIRESGNIVINASVATEKDDELYGLICKTVLKYFDSFPLGALRVHFIDPNRDAKFVQFINGIKSRSNQNARVGDMVSLCDDFSSYNSMIENHLRDLRPKLVGEIKDAYDLYKVDKTEQFNLFVIRSGFHNIAESGNGKDVSMIARMMDKNSIDHRCGFRFIIVNDVDVAASGYRLNDDSKRYIETIQKNADVLLEYKNSTFYYEDKKIAPISVRTNTDMESFIFEKCAKIGEYVRNLSSAAVTYKELGCVNSWGEPCRESIINIPVGKSGTKIVSIPFSCADSDESNSGKNIGLMVLGQSGSGKSSLYHSIIINGGLKYSPEDLEFWLLDFKQNSSAGVYATTSRNIPHIKMVAPNSKVDDAYHILGLLNEELERRNAVFNSLGERVSKNFKNVLEYNEYVRSVRPEGFPVFPRIVLMVDEAQEMFRESVGDSTEDELAKDISTLIGKIVDRGRSTGIHMALFAQNLESGKSYMLSRFIAQIQCKVCFRLSARSVNESGFKGGFDERKEEIESLGTGEIYLSYSATDMVKCRVAYAKGDEIISFLEQIIEKYPNNSSKVLKIGMTSKLTPNNKIASSRKNYLDAIFTPNVKNNRIVCTLGEDAYTLKPVSAVFDESAICSAIISGSSRDIQNSLLASLLISARTLTDEVYVCNGRPREDCAYNTIAASYAHRYAIGKIDECVSKVYCKYLDRRQDNEENECFDETPVFLFLNDFDDNNLIKKDQLLNLQLSDDNSSQKSGDAKIEPVDLDNNQAVDEAFAAILAGNVSTKRESSKKVFYEDVKIQAAIGALLKHGYKYHIYCILTIKDEFYRDFDEAITATRNMLVFNEYTGDSRTDYKLKQLLVNMKQEQKTMVSFDMDMDDEWEKIDNESFAILRTGTRVYKKFRPVIYSNESIDDLKKRLEELV